MMAFQSVSLDQMWNETSLNPTKQKLHSIDIDYTEFVLRTIRIKENLRMDKDK